MENVILMVGLVLALVVPAVALFIAKKEIKEELGSYADTLRIQVQHPGNPEFAVIHLNSVVYAGKEYLDNYSLPDEKYPEISHKLINIPGVLSVGPKKYEINLRKGDVFDYEQDILPHAIKIIKEHYGKGKKIEMLPTEDNRERAKAWAEEEKEYREKFGEYSYDY